MITAPGILAAALIFPMAYALRRLRVCRRRERLMRAPIPQDLLKIARQKAALYRLIPDRHKPELHGHMLNFLAEKRFEGCGGLTITQEMRVTIAAQACILLLGRRCTYFPKCDSILVYPTAYVADQKRRVGFIEVDERSVRLGESWVRGLVVLAWDEVERDAADPRRGRNVVLHEFAHQLDQEDGTSNGTPVLADRAAYSEWARVMSAEFLNLKEREHHHAHDVLDSYGATNEAEFFAVATEAFFCRSSALKNRHPELYGRIEGYYRLDPAGWAAGPSDS